MILKRIGALCLAKVLVFYGAMGFIVALISAGIYNAVAKRIGGIELGLE